MQENLFIHSDVLISRLHLHIAWRKCRGLAFKKKKIKKPLCEYRSRFHPSRLTSLQAFQPYEMQCRAPRSIDLYIALVTYNS